MSQPWFLYILECRDETLYTGVTNDIPKRLAKHNAGKGAKYTRSRRPCRLVYSERHKNESAARRREHEIKRWRRDKKLTLIIPKITIKLT